MITDTFKTLRRIYLITISLLVIIFIAAAFRWIDFSITPQPISATAERYILLLTIAAIPLSLWLFKKMLQGNRQSTDENFLLHLYKKAYFIRLIILGCITVLNLVCYGVSLKQNFMLCILMLFVTFAFCKPSIVEFEKIKPNQTLEK